MTSYIIRLVGIHDQTLLWSWRNDPQTRKMERITSIISRDAYARWLRLILGNQKYRMLIAETDVTAIAVACIYLRPEGNAEIGICLNPDFRGRGLAGGLLESFVTSARPALGFSRIRAAVKTINIPSRRLFTSAGYQVDVTAKDIIYFSKNLADCQQLQSPVPADNN